MLTKIYTLSCPISSDVRYIGKTNNPYQRLKAHNNKARDTNTHKRNWINSLRNKGLKPVFTIIDEVPIDNWQYWEKFYIEKYIKLGCKLVNYYDGGEGLTFGNRTSFKKGHNSRPIVALEKDGTYFNTFVNAYEAELIIGKKGIDSVLSCKTKTCGGYIWLYEDDYNSFSNDIIKAIVIYTKDHSKKGGKETRFKKGEIHIRGKAKDNGLITLNLKQI